MKREGPQRGRQRSTTHTAREQRGPFETIALKLPASVVEALRAVVKAGEAPNEGAFLEEAVREHFRRRRRKRVYAAYAEASRDPAFIEEMACIERVFDATVGDGTR